MTQWATNYANHIVENMSQAVLVTDVEFCVIHANSQAASLFGSSSAAELVGMTLSDAGGRDFVQFVPSFCGDVEKRPASGNYEVTTVFRAVGEVSVQFIATDQPPGAWLVFLTVCDKARYLDQQVFQSEKLAAMDNIVAGIAHELNNPMTAILGYAELLLATEENPRRKKRISLIAEEADRCAKIIGNLLSFTRSFGNKLESANVGALLDEVVSLRAYQMRVDGVDVMTRIDPDLPNIQVQPSAIRRLFLNLIHNAHQALVDVPRERREFVASAKQNSNSLSIEISDSGCGVPEAVRYKVFDPFFTTRSLGEGMGLGLSVAYGIVHEHQGKIWMTPRIGGGTTFHIELPIRATSQGESKGNVPESP